MSLEFSLIFYPKYSKNQCRYSFFLLRVRSSRNPSMLCDWKRYVSITNLGTSLVKLMLVHLPHKNDLCLWKSYRCGQNAIRLRICLRSLMEANFTTRWGIGRWKLKGIVFGSFDTAQIVFYSFLFLFISGLITWNYTALIWSHFLILVALICSPRLPYFSFYDFFILVRWYNTRYVQVHHIRVLSVLHPNI